MIATARSGNVNWRRWYRPLAVALTVIELTMFFAVAIWLLQAALDAHTVGLDLRVVLALGDRWRDTGSMYLPYQLSGGYDVSITPDLSGTPGLYPPAAGPLFAAMTFIPQPILYPLWWLVPISTVAMVIRSYRPAPWTWPVMAGILALPTTPLLIVVGGTSLWISAVVAIGLRWRGWPTALVLLKPSMVPFAIIGVRDRWWWLAVVVVGGLTLAGPWLDYISVARNAQGLDYALWSYPLAALPIVAWLGRDRNLASGPGDLRSA